MEKVDYCRPHPDWEEVIIWWHDITDGPRYPITKILEWIAFAPGGRYHLHGHDCTAGFAFRFENPKDATYFRLKWL